MSEGQIRERKEISPRRGRWQKSLRGESFCSVDFGEIFLERIPGLEGVLQREGSFHCDCRDFLGEGVQGKEARAREAARVWFLSTGSLCFHVALLRFPGLMKFLSG